MISRISKIFLFSLLFPLATNAATLYLDPASANVAPGDVFGMYVKINNDDGECINAGELNIDFPKDKLAVEDLATGESLFNIWIEKPEKSRMEAISGQGKISFSGGIPGGYCGKIPGDPGDSNILGEIFFKTMSDAKSGDIVNVNFDENTKILLNDGFGTSAKLTKTGAKINIVSATEGSKEEYKDMLKFDKQPPENFIVELQKDARVYNGKYYIIFSTTDKQTGVDHYEIQEIPLSQLEKKPGFREWLGNLFGKKASDLNTWKRGASPYLLEDQTLNSVVRVKAVDKAGNEKLVEYTPEMKFPKPVSPMNPMKTILGLVIAAIILLIIAIVKKRKSSYNKDN